MKDGGVEAYRAKVQELERDIRSGETQIESALAELGERVFNTRPAPFLSHGGSEPFDRADAFRNAIATKGDQIARIRQLVGEIGRVDERIARSDSEIQRLVQQNIPHYEKIGHAAFESYRENPFGEQEYAEVFHELVQTQDDLMGLEKSIRETQSDIENKPMIERMVSRGRLALLRSRRSAKISSFPKMYRAAGEKIGTSEFLSMNQDESLSSVAAPFLENMKRIKSQRGELDTDRSTRESLHGELESLSAGQRAQRRVSILEAEQRGESDELRATFREIGYRFREWASGDSGEAGAVPDAAGLLKNVAGIETSNAARRKAIERLQAAIEIERLAREESGVQESISRLEEQITRGRAEISDLNDRLARLSDEKKRLTKIRGSESSLLSL